MALLRRTFEPRIPQRVRINLNATTPDGLIRIGGSHFRRAVRPGDLVRIYEPVDEIEGLAHVAQVNSRTGLVYLEVIWESLRDLEALHLNPPVEPSNSPVRSLVPAGHPQVLYAELV